MPFVRCSKCYKEFKKPFELERHKLRKTPCNGVKINDKKINKLDIIIKDDNIINDNIINDNINILFKMVNELKKSNDNLIKNNNNINSLLTDYKKENDDLKKQVKKLNKNVEKMEIISKNNGINNNNNCIIGNDNTVIYNINIVNHGSEIYKDVVNFDKLSDKLSDNSYNKEQGEIIQRIFTQIHLNVKYPHYYNIYVPNTRKNVIMVYINGEWIQQNKKHIINGLIDRMTYYVDDGLKIIKEDDKLNLWFNYRQATNHINTLLGYNGNFYTITNHKTQIFKDIENMLYENKTMIINKEKREKIKSHSINNNVNLTY